MNPQHETITVLKALIATSNDGEFVFRAAVRRARSADLAMTFAGLADNCQQGARELQKCVVRLGGPVVTDRGFAALWRHSALSARRLLYGNDDLALLKASRRVEEEAEKSYGKALERPWPAAVQALIERHYRGVRFNHARIRDLLVMHQAIGPLNDHETANIVALRSVPGRAGNPGETTAGPLGAGPAGAPQRRSVA